MLGRAGAQQSAFGGSISFSLLLGSRTRETAGQSIVPFMTRVFVERSLRFVHRDFCGPRLGPRRLIVDREFVKERVLVGASETFDDAQMLAGSSEICLVVEIGCFVHPENRFPSMASLRERGLHKG